MKKKNTRIIFKSKSAVGVKMGLKRAPFSAKMVSKGDPFTADNVRSIRPGYGLPPKHFRDFLDRPAARDIKRGEPLSWDMVNSNSGTENDQSLS